MRMDKMTSKFQMALAEAQSLALGRDHQFIEPIHLMAALLDQELFSSWVPAAPALQSAKDPILVDAPQPVSVYKIEASSRFDPGPGRSRNADCAVRPFSSHRHGGHLSVKGSHL